jgi:glutaminyl-peptide cyclotransferase
MQYKIWIPLLFLLILFSCSEKKPSSQPPAAVSKPLIHIPEFNADSAYRYVEEQLAFGPRVPNTPQHEACANYLSDKMKSWGAEVIVQKAKVKAFDQTVLNISNIIAQFDVNNPNRILLFAHWDTRPFADHHDDPSRRDEPILGASDGASGVAVLMEIARNLQQHPSKFGIDIIFFDAEDYGTPDHRNLPYNPDTWCLGSQYWGKNLHKLGYYPKYGILLDMVGAKGALFYQERYSLSFAPGLVQHVWKTASELGYSNYFLSAKGGMITDDHVYVNQLTGIPCINIIQHDPSSATGFGTYWHTHNDNLDIIDLFTLGMVGKTVTTVIYREGN